MVKEQEEQTPPVKVPHGSAAVRSRIMNWLDEYKPETKNRDMLDFFYSRGGRVIVAELVAHLAKLWGESETEATKKANSFLLDWQTHRRRALPFTVRVAPTGEAVLYNIQIKRED